MNIHKILLLVVFIVMMPKFSFSEEAFSFEGQIDFPGNEFNIVLSLDDKSSVAARAQKTPEGDYRFSLDVEHLRTPFFDLLSKIESSVEFVKGKDSSGKTSDVPILRGAVWSQYSLVDYKPIQELSGRFEVTDKRLYLTALSVGSLACDGYVGLVSPYEIDLIVNLFGIGMSDFLNFWGSGKKYESSGSISGEIKISGALDRLVLKGSLESRNGFVQKLYYDAILLNIEGVYPHMEISRSTISKSNGVSFSLEGPFDLSDKANFKKQIKALTVAPLVSGSDSELEWTIKRLNPKNFNTTEFKYRLSREGILGDGIFTGRGIDMLGVERTRKF